VSTLAEIIKNFKCMRRPWNLNDTCVYSLATYSNEQVNMNICTYVTAISMKPKLYAIAIYNNTKSLYNMQNNQYCVLQYLHKSQYNLVQNLGKKSGIDFNKYTFLHKRNLIEKWNGYEVLKNTCALVLLKKVNAQQTGDHVLFTFEMIKYASFTDELLTHQVLIDKKIIRA
jgi:flavin reductase (DIM6/NTAB) family NADH-FMN oxidoreductase RutF